MLRAGRRASSLPARSRARRRRSEGLRHLKSAVSPGVSFPLPLSVSLHPQAPQEKFAKNVMESVKQQMPTLSSGSVRAPGAEPQPRAAALVSAAARPWHPGYPWGDKHNVESSYLRAEGAACEAGAEQRGSCLPARPVRPRAPAAPPCPPRRAPLPPGSPRPRRAAPASAPRTSAFRGTVPRQSLPVQIPRGFSPPERGTKLPVPLSFCQAVLALGSR